MNKIIVTKEVKIPDTDIILEAGDEIIVYERLDSQEQQDLKFMKQNIGKVQSIRGKRFTIGGLVEVNGSEAQFVMLSSNNSALVYDFNNQIMDEVSLDQISILESMREANRTLRRELGILAKNYDVPEFYEAVWEMASSMWRSLNIQGKEKYGLAFGKIMDSLGKVASIAKSVSIKDQSIFAIESRTSVKEADIDIKKVIKEQEFDVQKAIQDFINVSWSDSEESAGKALNLLKGLIFSKDSNSTKFVKALDKKSNELNADDFK